MEVMYNKVLGIDVHQAVLACCIVTCENGEIVTQKREFRTYGEDLHKMARWAESEHVDLVIMESTGIYWRTPYQVLEKFGMKAAVVNARQVKQMEGKKTDMGDAEWLAHVGRLGVFNRSYIPDLIYRELRTVSREMMKLIDDLSAEKNRFGKTLTDCGYRLYLVFSDIFGVNATKAIDALIEGKTVDQIIGMLNLNMLRKSPDEIKAALDGNMSESHRITLVTCREHMDCLNRLIAKLRNYLKEKVEAIHHDALLFLQTIPGISEDSAVVILIELGGENMDAFGRAARLASWLGVCPGNNESAGKRKHGHIRKGNYYLRRILCECATAAVKTRGTTFKSKFTSLRIRKSYKQALIAIVHKMVLCIFTVLMRKKAYIDPQIDYELESANKNARRWVKILCTLPEWQVAATDLRSGENFQSDRATA